MIFLNLKVFGDFFFLEPGSLQLAASQLARQPVQPAGQAGSPASWPGSQQLASGAAVDKQIAKIDENTYQKVQITMKLNRHLTTMASIEKVSFSLDFP